MLQGVYFANFSFVHRFLAWEVEICVYYGVFHFEIEIEIETEIESKNIFDSKSAILFLVTIAFLLFKFSELKLEI